MIPATLNITAAEPVGEYALRLSFDDGTVQTVDFKPFLSLSRHPDIRAYLEPSLFAAFRHRTRRIGGGITTCASIADLYQNRLSDHVGKSGLTHHQGGIMSQTDMTKAVQNCMSVSLI
jgi:hypothetical protein